MGRSSLKNVARLIEATTKELPDEQSFLADLKRSIELTDEKGWGIPSQTYKPSSMKCIRNMYYQVMGVEPDKGESSYTMVGICNSGSDIHDRIQKHIEGMKLNNMDCEYIDVETFINQRDLKNLTVREKCGMETKLRHELYNMSFMTDGIIKYKNKYYILEIKTETSYKWQMRKEVDPKHYAQGTAYSIAFGLDDVIFLYINRDILDMKAFMFHVTDEMKQDLVGKITECDGYVERKICPPKPELAKNVCTYCSYKEQCRKDS